MLSLKGWAGLTHSWAEAAEATPECSWHVPSAVPLTRRPGTQGRGLAILKCPQGSLECPQCASRAPSRVTLGKLLSPPAHCCLTCEREQ